MAGLTTIDQYIEEVKKINEEWHLNEATTHAWFRGQSDFDWDLVPGIYRNGGTGFFEREMIRDFRLNARSFVGVPIERELEWLFVMQHYGMPTRLLDWTESYLFGLYFSVLNYHTDKDACVWMLSPWSLNEVVLQHRTVPTIDYPNFENYELNSDPKLVERQVKNDLPVAARPFRTTPRIVAQKGTFTIHGKDGRPLNKIVESLNAGGENIKIAKIRIDGKSKLELVRQLHFAGISHSVLFPELEAVSKEISFRYSRQYLADDKAHAHAGF